MESADYFLPKRPSINKTGREINLSTNFFRLTATGGSTQIFFKYSVEIFPEVPDDSIRQRMRIFNTKMDELKEYLGEVIFNNTTLYSRANYPDDIEIDTNFRDQDYKLIIKWANQVESITLEALSLYKKFLGNLTRKIGFVQVRKSYFNSKEAMSIDQMEVWPGFNSTVNIYPCGALVNINLIHKILRQETALDVIQKLRQKAKNGTNCKEEIQRYFSNIVVLTRYNNDKTYVIDSVDFEKNPSSTFDCKGYQVSYGKYYLTKYDKNIRVKDQPLLVCLNKKTNEEIHLIPEICFLTGITEEMRNNFNLMKQLATITKGDANRKLGECVSLVKTLLNNEKCKQDIDRFGLSIDSQPVSIVGRKLNAGNILMHKNAQGRFSFPIESTRDIDREIQKEMFSQPNIDKWIVRKVFTFR